MTRERRNATHRRMLALLNIQPEMQFREIAQRRASARELELAAVLLRVADRRARVREHERLVGGGFRRQNGIHRAKRAKSAHVVARNERMPSREKGTRRR